MLAVSRDFGFWVLMVRLMNPKVRFAVAVMRSMWRVPGYCKARIFGGYFIWRLLRSNKIRQNTRPQNTVLNSVICNK